MNVPKVEQFEHSSGCALAISILSHELYRDVPHSFTSERGDLHEIVSLKAEAFTNEVARICIAQFN